ncbi:MAG: MFS transporter [Trueperaceae bacterium]
MTLSFARSRLVQARWAVITIFFVNGMCVASWLSRVPAIKDIIQGDELIMSRVLLGPAVGAIISFPVTAFLLGRFGSRVVTIVTSLLLCSALALLSLGSSPLSFFMLLFVFGFCNAANDVSMNAQAAEVEAGLAKPIMSSFHGTFSAGGILGALLARYFAGQDIGLGVHLPSVALCLAVVSSIAAFYLLPTKPQPSDAPVFALPSKAVFLVGLIGFCALVGEGAMGDWSALYLRDSLNTDEGFAAYGYAAFAVAMTFGRFVGDTLTKRLGAKRLVMLGGFLTASGLGLGLLLHTVWSALLGFTAVGLGLSIMFPIMVTIASQQSPDNKGAAIAAVATMGYTGFLLGPPLIGFVAHYSSLSWGLGVVAILALVIAGLGSCLPKI